MKTTVVILAACSLSFGIGLFAGRITAPMSEARPAFDPAGNAISEALLSHGMVPDGEATAGQDPKGTKQNFLEDLQNDPRIIMAQKLANWTDDPAAVVGTVIDGMNQDEIAVILSSLTSLDREELGDIEDLPKYAKRLAQLALNDVTQEPNYYDPDLRPVYFSLDPNPEKAIEAQQQRFGAEKSRMHAILPMQGYQKDSVFVKWTRNSDQQVMLFDRYPIRVNDEYNWVYFEPEAGWEKGGYTVSFLSDDEEMGLLGSGDYVAE
ncbi:MAG: hypothetical protein ACJZ7Z_06885 [Myxococcota bacterium]